MTHEEYSKEALRLAGKMANCAANVCNSSARNLSNRVVDLEKTLSDYNDFVVEWTLAKRKPTK